MKCTTSRQERKKAAEARWGKKADATTFSKDSSASGMQMHNTSNANGMQGKEKKVKESIKDTVHQDELFEEWWNLYAKKEGRAKCVTKYRSLLKKYPHDQMMAGTKSYLNNRKDLQSRGEFCPQQKNPLTFLNGEHFNDEYGTPAAAPVQHAPFVPNWNAGED